jgi:hypothetical protein
MPSLWFVVPAHGRVELSRICFRQLRRTCDALAGAGIEATAVVIACDENLDTARELGFATVERNNEFLSARFNDGIQAALDPEWNPRPADFVVPCGSDDWIDHRILGTLPGPWEVLAFRHAAFVNERGDRIAARRLDYRGGVGVRVYPSELMRVVDYRPADEDRKRACDTSILVNLTAACRSHQKPEPVIVYRDRHEWQIVDWKTHGQQLNTFEMISARHGGQVARDPFAVLAGSFPSEALDEMRAHYDRQLVAA